METLSNEELYALLSKKVNSINTGGGNSGKSESDIVFVNFTRDNNNNFICDTDYEELKTISKSKFVIARFMGGILYPVPIRDDICFSSMRLSEDTEGHPIVFEMRLTNTSGSWTYSNYSFKYEKIKEYLEESDFAKKNDLLEYQHETIIATETMGQITVQSFTSNAVQSLLSILNDYPNKTIEVKLTSSTFSNTTMILELTQYTDTEVHFTGDCFINGKFVFMDLKVDSTDTWTFTSKQYTEVS